MRHQALHSLIVGAVEVSLARHAGINQAGSPLPAPYPRHTLTPHRQSTADPARQPCGAYCDHSSSFHCSPSVSSMVGCSVWTSRLAEGSHRPLSHPISAFSGALPACSPWQQRIYGVHGVDHMQTRLRGRSRCQRAVRCWRRVAPPASSSGRVGGEFPSRSTDRDDDERT
jgi:hypothetical protein